jgi:2-keto-4-pentenoate hydratase/2-oxohepta-3-ene-1,7-dioic acid hydratase in catechol pathway
MKLARVLWHGKPIWAIIEGATAYRLAGDRFAKSRKGPPIAKAGRLRLLAPIDPTNKIIGMLGNFGARGNRRGPGLFLKPNSTVIGHKDTVVQPSPDLPVHFEAELGVVIGRRAKNVPEAKALSHVLGYTIVNDATTFPALKEDGGPSVRFKIYDTFCPIGPWIVTGIDAGDLRLTSRLNGRICQDISTMEMCFTMAEVISWVTSVMTLHPGDIITMGTPPGNAEMRPGDRIECAIEQIGVLANRVAAAKSRPAAKGQ